MAMVKTWQAHPHIDTLRLSIKGPYGIAIYLKGRSLHVDTRCLLDYSIEFRLG